MNFAFDLRNIICYLLENKTTIGGVIAVPIILLYIRHRLNIRRDLRNPAIQEFAKAATEFRNTFTKDELFFKKPHTDQKTCAEYAFTLHLRERFPVHEAAMQKFRAVLPDNQKAAFDNAWERYKYAGEHKNSNRKKWEEYEFHLYTVTIKNDKNRRKAALKYLNKLLKFSDINYVFRFKISNLYWLARNITVT